MRARALGLYSGFKCFGFKVKFLKTLGIVWMLRDLSCHGANKAFGGQCLMVCGVCWGGGLMYPLGLRGRVRGVRALG